MGNAIVFGGDRELPEALTEHMPPEALEHMRDVTARFERIADLLDDGRVYLPFTVVHAHRVDYISHGPPCAGERNFTTGLSQRAFAQ